MDTRQGGTFQRPTTGPDNKPITQRPWEDRNHRVIPPSREHIDIMHNPRLEENIRHEQARWNGLDHGYYWHNWDGRQMCHHYDDRGFHWWGFYVRDTYFWTRYWNDRYWWHDPYWNRWCYMRDSFWWWQDPVGIVYIYRDGRYYRYDNAAGGVVIAPDPTPPVEPPPADPTPAPTPDPQEKTFYSADGTRTVQVFGENKDAFLYDTADPPAFEPKWLDSGVTDVRFKLDDQGQLVAIMTLKDDGGFNLFDKDGKSQNIAPAPQPQPVPALPAPQPLPALPAPADGQGDDGASSVGQSLQKSSSFNALKTGSFSW